MSARLALTPDKELKAEALCEVGAGTSFDTEASENEGIKQRSRRPPVRMKPDKVETASPVGITELNSVARVEVSREAMKAIRQGKQKSDYFYLIVG